MTPRICVSILPENNTEALNLIERAKSTKADFIEVRLDCLEINGNLSEFPKCTTIPLIATNKLQSEKGFFSGTEAERQQTLLSAAKNGFQYVDIDLSSPDHKKVIHKLKQLGAKTIVSFHKHDSALSIPEMGRILEQEILSGADICKIVTTAKKIEDNLGALNFVSAKSGRVKLVCFCMGEQGKVSRLLSPLFGAYFTFASLEQGNETAAGQITIAQMQAAYDVLGQK
ncbi:MAG: type I 3-dehydroquinate dehydratase [Candidatus Bathyarchaeia archaeon]